MRVPGLQTGVCSQLGDRCACVMCPGPEPVCLCPSCALGSVRLGGGERWCLPSEDLAGQALSAMPESRWASLGRVVACLRVVRPGFAAGPLRQARVVLSPAFQTWNSLGACCLARRGVGGGCEPAGCASRPGCLYFKTCCPLRARQLWVCSMLLLTAAAVGATQPSAAKMRLDPLPLQCCSGWPGLQ